MDIWIVMKGLEGWPTGKVEEVFIDEADAMRFAMHMSLTSGPGPKPTSMRNDPDGALVITDGLTWIKAFRATAKDSFEIPG